MRRVLYLWIFSVFTFVSFNAQAQSFDSLQNIRIIVTFNSAPTVYNVTKAPLRFNKLFAFSMAEDDGDKDIYTNAFPVLNGGSVGGVPYPGLTYTDGCGNDQKFKMSAAIFSFSAQGSTLVDMHDPSGSFASTNVTWPQLIEMYQQNWSVENHGLTSGVVGTPGYEVARNGSYIKLKMQSATTGGPDLKIFVNPNGTLTYSSYAWNQGYTICYREGYTFGDPGFDVTGPFPHQNFGMHRTNGYESVNLSALVDNLATASTGGAHQWGVAFTHSVTNSMYGYSFSTFQNHMNYISNTYGKNGLDNILMATEEEVIDYLMVRDSININTQLNGNVLTITFTGSLTNKYRFYNSTLLITSDRIINSLVTQGVQTATSTGVGSANGMVNISWNGHYVVPPEVNAETWVSTTEASHNQEDANIAVDYVLMVPPGPEQQAFRIRLCQVPVITLPSDFCTYRNAPVCTIPNTGGCPGHSLIIPVKVDSFLNIKACYQRFEYDPAVMTFASGTAGKPSILNGMQITDQPVGGSSTLRKILLSWSDATPKSLSVHDTLALLTFNFISGNTLLAFNTTSNGGNDCRYVDDGDHPMYQYPSGDFFINGQVTNARLPAPGTITGPSSICQGTTNNTYIAAVVAGATSYAWTFPVGFSVTQGANHDTIVVTAGSDAVSGNIFVRAVNACNDNPSSAPFPVTVKSRPIPVITGPGSTCALAPALTYSTETGMTDYNWIVSSGGNISSGQGTNTIIVNWMIPGPQTVSVVYRGLNGCMAPVPTIRDVTVNPLPLPVITGLDTVCRTASVIFSTTTGMQSYQWNVSSSGTIVSGASSPVVTVRWDNPGPQWISLNYSNAFGCQALSAVTKNIYVRPIAQPVITGADSLCEGTSGVIYTTQAGMTNYVWSISSGGIITSGEGTSAITVQWNDPGVHLLNLNYTFPGGCPATNPYILPVNVHARPQPHIVGPDSLCKGSSGVLYYTESGMNNYQWTISSGGIINSGAGTDSVMTSWITSGSQFVNITYINSFGCIPAGSVSYNIHVNDLPSPSIAGPSTACNYSTGTVYTTQAGKTNYFWTISPGGLITSGQGHDTVQVSWNTTGLQQITVNYFDSNFCTSPIPASFTVMVLETPAPSISGPSTACEGVSVMYTTQAAMSNYVWILSAGGTILSGQGSQTISVKWNLAGPASVSVNYTNSSGCRAVSPASYSVTVFPAPAPTITGSNDICLNSVTTYTTQLGMNNYTWAVSAGGTILSGSGSPSVQVKWNGSGNQLITLTYINSQGCSPLQPAQKTVTVHSLPSPVIEGPSSVCNYSTNQVYYTQSGKSDYTWTISNGGIITSGQGTDSVRVSWNTTGLNHLTVNYLDSNGCTAPQPATYTVTVNPLPNPSISGPSSVCVGVSGIQYTTQIGMNNYLWNLSSGGTIESGLGTEAILVTWDSAGTRSVSVNYSNSFGCLALIPDIKVVTVHPLPVPTITGPDSLCMNSTGIYSTESGMMYYQWVISPGGSIVTGMGTDSIHVTWTTYGPRTVSVNYLNGNYCSAASSTVLSVNVFPLPVPLIFGDSTVCANSTGSLYTTESGMSNYTWTIAAGSTIISGQGTDSVTVNWGNAGASSISVTYTSPKGCNPVTPAIKTVTINPRPIPSITGSNTVCINAGPKTYTTQPGQQNYLWNISSGDTILTGIGTSSVTAQWTSTGNHWISVTYSSPAGCQAMMPDTLPVAVNPLPSAASPISGDSVLCVPAAWQEYSVAPIPNASGYFWTIPPGAVFQGNFNSNVIHVTYLPDAQSGNITVYGTNPCGNGTSSSLFVVLHPVPPTPVVTLGQDYTLISSLQYGNQWYQDYQPLPGDTLNQYHVDVTGDYFTIVTIGICSSDTSNIKHVIVVGIEENDGSGIDVHPNPTSGKLSLDFNNLADKLYKVILLNELGATLFQSEQLIPSGKSSWVIDIGNISPGPMIMVIQAPDKIFRKKIIKN